MINSQADEVTELELDMQGILSQDDIIMEEVKKPFNPLGEFIKDCEIVLPYSLTI